MTSTLPPERPAVKAWRDCRNQEERAAVVLYALQTHGTVKLAARALGISRRYLTKLLPPGEARRIRETMENRENTVLTSTRDTRDIRHSENATNAQSLTYGRPVLSFRDVNSVATTNDQETLSLGGIPKPVKDWLQEKALRRMQESGGRFAIAPVVVAILEKAMADDKGGPE